MTSRRQLSLAPSTSTSLKTKMTTYASGMAAVLALAVVGVLMMPGELTGRLPGYKWRKSLTIDSTQVAQGAVLTDFILYVELEDEALKHAKYGGKVEHSTGDDLRFTGADGALMLAQQIESYDGKKGQLVAWVRLDTLRQAQPPTLFLYFGNPKIRFTTSPIQKSHWKSKRKNRAATRGAGSLFRIIAPHRRHFIR
jgi:hypothetical protein